MAKISGWSHFDKTAAVAVVCSAAAEVGEATAYFTLTILCTKNVNSDLFPKFGF